MCKLQDKFKTYKAGYNQKKMDPLKAQIDHWTTKCPRLEVRIYGFEKRAGRMEHDIEQNARAAVRV